MASEPARRAARSALAMSAALAVLAAVAGSLYPSPRALAACATAAAAVLWILLRALRILVAAGSVKSEDMPPGLPQEGAAALEQLLTLEATLEHAPIALFNIDDMRSTAPLNAFARRLIAPGRVISVEELYAKLVVLQPGGRNMIVYDTERGQERALAAVGAMTRQGSAHRLVALMTIESELESAAQRAWQQLVRVLTHEIMNSLTPVASLSHTARELLDDWRCNPAAGADADLATALEAIARRADSLAAFVASYRSLSSVPPPQAERLRLSDLFSRLAALCTPAWEARGGAVRFQVEPESLELLADPGQVEQALINLLQNAAEATLQVRHAQASVTARLGRGGRLLIEVQDNGPGVPDNLIEQIFTPFFSTKPKGSGIGLAVVRQLVHGNGGTVRYIKPASGGARFVLTF